MKAYLKQLLKEKELLLKETTLKEEMMGRGYFSNQHSNAEIELMGEIKLLNELLKYKK